jgi:hypothetical protein
MFSPGTVTVSEKQQGQNALDRVPLPSSLNGQAVAIPVLNW